MILINKSYGISNTDIDSIVTKEIVLTHGWNLWLLASAYHESFATITKNISIILCQSIPNEGEWEKDMPIKCIQKVVIFILKWRSLLHSKVSISIKIVQNQNENVKYKSMPTKTS